MHLENNTPRFTELPNSKFTSKDYNTHCCPNINSNQLSQWQIISVDGVSDKFGYLHGITQQQPYSHVILWHTVCHSRLDKLILRTSFSWQDTQCAIWRCQMEVRFHGLELSVVQQKLNRYLFEYDWYTHNQEVVLHAVGFQLQCCC